MATKSSPAVFVDTAYLVALLNQRDRWHAHARALAQAWAKAKTPLLTTDAVLIELGNFFCKSPLRPRIVPAIRQIRGTEGWTVVPTTSELTERGEERYADHEDKHWSLTDCLSMEAMTDEGCDTIATTDDHFSQAGFRILMKG
jgi:uncharacterized protein